MLARQAQLQLIYDREIGSKQAAGANGGAGEWQATNGSAPASMSAAAAASALAPATAAA